MRKFFLLVFCSAFVGNLFGQVTEVPIKFSGQIRVRSESDGRDFNNDTSLNSFTLLRTRFAAEVEALEDVTVLVQIQDSRAFGQEPGTLSNTSNLDIHQAYFQIDNLWNKPIHLRAGRQELIYGNERIIGAVGWSNVGRAFDGIKWTFGRNNKLDVFGMIINESDTPVAGAATSASVRGLKEEGNYFYGAYYQYRSTPDYKFDFYGLFQSFLQETVPGKNDLSRVTLGTYDKGRLSNSIGFESELALQFGKRQGQDVLAFMLTGSLGYSFQSANSPIVRIGFDYLSGMDVDDEDYKVFDNLFGTSHKFYGFMDYFLSIPANTGGRGLQDFQVNARIPLVKTWNLNAYYHNFRAAKGVEKDFGNELDLILNYKYSSAASFVFGLAFFIPGDLMRAAFANDDVAVWSYATLLVDF